MLNIPAEIQALYKTDSVRKNFRVHFPNGESPDLTNSDIVAGSVSFTESVCSKDVLQFGLAEASRIEFECANVQNIYGMTIECGIEVDTSSLSAADITTIQGNPGDGTLVLSADSDIGYGYYRIPYGVFTVTSCPRSAGAMWKRRVEAYEESIYKRMTAPLRAKLSYQERRTTESLLQSAFLLVAGEINNVDDINLRQTYTGGGNHATSQHFQDFPKWTYNGTDYRVLFGGFDFYYGVTQKIAGITGAHELWQFNADVDTTEIDAIVEDMESYGAGSSAVQSFYDRTLPAVCYQTGLSTIYTPKMLTRQGYAYLYAESTDGYVGYYVHSQIVIQALEGGSWTTKETYTPAPYVSNAVFSAYAIDTFEDDILIRLKATSEDASGKFSFVDSLDITALIEGVLELNAKYGKRSRNGAFLRIPLSKSSPISMSTSEYSDLWWDEYNIAPIGSVTLTYFDIDLDQEQTIAYDFGGGISEYDMTDNYLLKNLAVSVNDLTNQTVEEFVTGLLDTYFIPNIQDIAFTPVQLSSLGLPYLEAGDYLEIDDGNGNTVGTYIMSRTLSGVQFLEDDIESKGGEIIGNVRSA